MKIFNIKMDNRFIAITFLAMTCIGLMQLNKVSQVNVRAISAIINLFIFLIAVNNIEAKGE